MGISFRDHHSPHCCLSQVRRGCPPGMSVSWQVPGSVPVPPSSVQGGAEGCLRLVWSIRAQPQARGKPSPAFWGCHAKNLSVQSPPQRVWCKVSRGNQRAGLGQGSLSRQRKKRHPEAGEQPRPPSHLCVSGEYWGRGREGFAEEAPLKLGFRGRRGVTGRWGRGQPFLAEGVAGARKQGLRGAFPEAFPQEGARSWADGQGKLVPEILVGLVCESLFCARGQPTRPRAGSSFFGAAWALGRDSGGPSAQAADSKRGATR